MQNLFVKISLTTGAGLLLLAGQAGADTWNKKTHITFPDSVELPGRVVIPPGTYTMKLADSSSNRNIVQVFNRDENQIFATFFAIPQYRERPADKTIITFHETPGSAPRFIHTWYYPGDTVGREFTYSKERAAYIASLTGSTPAVAAESKPGALATRETPTPEPSTSNIEPVDQQERVAGGGDVTPSSSPDATDDAEVPGEEPEQTPAAADQQPAPAQQPATAQQPSSTPEQLPATASDIPLVALSGIVLLGLGTFVRLRRASS